MSALRKLKAMVLGTDDSIQASNEQLQNAGVPISTADCRSCPDPCDHGHEEYPARWNVDMESQMFGSVKAYRRQVVISTGKSDWPSVIELVSDSLALPLAAVLLAAPKPPRVEHSNHSNDTVKLPGVFDNESSSRISVLNGSHHTISDDHDTDTVLVLPDYKVVTEVARTKEGAEQLYRHSLDPTVTRIGNVFADLTLQSWVLPYACVILLCSHKRRDNRCGIAAVKLEHGLRVALEHEGWEVHDQVEHPSHHSASLEEFKGSEEEKQEDYLNQLKEAAESKRALIIRNSHMGGHKFAGNCIIYTPQGASVWYGRVTPHQVEAVVKDTIIGGKVLPPLLRGGLNLSRPGYGVFLDLRHNIFDILYRRQPPQTVVVRDHELVGIRKFAMDQVYLGL